MNIGKSILEAKSVLENSGIVAIPTETVYGLAANALNEKAILSVFKAKNRPHFDPLIVHISDITELHKYAKPTAKLEKLASNYWPGPLTILLHKKECIPDLVTAGSDKVAIRVPSHPLTGDLLKAISFPLVAPSANTFGYVSPTTAQHVLENLGDKVDYILDGDQTKIGIESTIVSEDKGKVIIHRLGAISIESLEEFLEEKIALQIQNNSNPQAPGMLDKHYSPLCKLEMYSEEKTLDKTATLIWFGSNPPKDFNKAHNLSQDGSLEEAATNLFSVLRSLDKNNINKAYIKLVPKEGLGRAINDRISRATKD